jgi:hypothetical protein
MMIQLATEGPCWVLVLLLHFDWIVCVCMCVCVTLCV